MIIIQIYSNEFENAALWFNEFLRCILAEIGDLLQVGYLEIETQQTFAHRIATSQRPC